MKKVFMTIQEFLQFRQVAEKYRIFFTYGIKKNEVTVKENAGDLAQIGY